MPPSADLSLRMYRDSTYETPCAGRPLPLAMRLLPGVAARFYAGIVHVVWWSRRQAGQGKFDAEKLTEASEMTARVVEAVGGRIRVDGLEHLSSTPGAAVIIGNHMSSLETFLLPGIIGPRKPLGFVIKESLLRHPLFGPVMRSVPSIALTRDNPRRDLQLVMEQGTDFLRRGVSFCIFPQATRNFTFDESRFNTLGVKLARRAGVPVIPVALRTDLWGNGKRVKDVGPVRVDSPVRVAFGAPILPGLPQAEIHGRVVEFVRGRLQEWGVPCVKGEAGPEEKA